MNYTLNAFPQYIQSASYFKRDAQQWIVSLGNLPQTLPVFLAKTLRSECIESQWLDGVLALEKAMQPHSAYETLWGGNAATEDSALLVALQADCLPVFNHFLGRADFDLVTGIFLGVAPQYSPTLKRQHLNEMLEALAVKMMENTRKMSQWLSTEKNQDLLEDTLAFSRLNSLWGIFEPYASFENKWGRVSEILLKAEGEQKYFHPTNPTNQQLLNMWAARPNLSMLTEDVKKMVANHIVFADIAAVVSKDVLEKVVEDTTTKPKVRRL